LKNPKKWWLIGSVLVSTLIFTVPGKITEEIGISLPANNTCQTFTATPDPADFALLITGDTLEAFTQYSSGVESEANYMNNSAHASF
jgi:hypothetical protein